MSEPLPPLSELLARNRAWSEARTDADPGFFGRLAQQQSPRWLWIGCSDSRIPANVILDLDPGEVFVHRNIANLVKPGDPNALAVVEFAIEVLKAPELLVVGHYGCGGVRAALEGGAPPHVDSWLAPLKALVRAHRDELDALPAGPPRENRLAELNVAHQVANLAAEPIVRAAWARGQPLSLHGWIYDVGDGLARDLGVSVGYAPVSS